MSLPRALLQDLLATEGVYSNDPADVGGETFCGISRVYHPGWGGWGVLDAIKAKGSADTKERLAPLVRQFYEAQFWNRFLGDKLPAGIAAEIFDTAVNMGVHRAVTFLQQTLNALSRNFTLYPKLSEDGGMGGKSLAALQITLAHDPEALVLKMLNVCQGAHYMAYVHEDSKQGRFVRGWFGRVKI